MRSAHHLLQKPHIGRKERSNLIGFCDYIFLSGKCWSKLLGSDDLSNSRQLDKAWAWKLRQARLICYSFWQHLGKSKVWRGEGEWRWREGFFFLSTCWSRLENLLFYSAPIKVAAVCSSIDVSEDCFFLEWCGYLWQNWSPDTKLFVFASWSFQK